MDVISLNVRSGVAERRDYTAAELQACAIARAAWEAGERQRRIVAIEASITSRRLREAALDHPGARAWLAERDAEIDALRKAG